ncbi:uncharacterized protein EV420DRAFT_437245 [Desarmillaria tabescens]|uniref:Uncharacterized protein n=1 Tax=Armillaria tabescens TaxID=1929756 RepID=A0AA39NLS6_ARMTA|nr:uncharacterized protein EV420DRAFT_437245 [Desarmillaria tabescens]KAK0467961.1 hypothetical protein EV420DRAFT_437245 [Desarmillaria tabescens]
MASSLFSGLCFGDISPSQESSSSMQAATLPDTPNNYVTPGCGDRVVAVVECDVTPPAVQDNISCSPSDTNYSGGFDSSGYDLDGDTLPTDPKDEYEYLPPDTASFPQNACIPAIVSTDTELIEHSQGAYNQLYDPALNGEPLAVLSTSDIPNLNTLDPVMNNEQIQPDTYPDNLSAPLQEDSLQSNYVGRQCSPDRELVAESTQNASQNSRYNFHSADEPGLDIAHDDSNSLTSSSILPERADCDVDLIQFSPADEALYSSPPCSSPNKIFSSSPPLSSQSSAITEPYPDESEANKRTIDYDYDDQSQLISLNSSERPWDEVNTIELDASDVLPPSSSPVPLVSSPFPSSSPLQTVQEDTKPSVEKPDTYLLGDQFSHTSSETEIKDSPPSQGTSTSHATAEVTQELDAVPEFPTQETHVLDDIAPAPQLPEAPSHVKSHATLAPGPKRPTVMSHLQQRKKFSTPFRSPLIKKENDHPVSPLPAVTKPSFSAVKTIVRSEVKSVEHVLNDPKKKHRTVRAAAQFKSPLSAAASSNVIPSVRMTPTIQSLERQVQILRRAVKVKKDGEEELLESLAKRWTEAAREVAWELWDLVKDNGTNEAGGWGNTWDRPKTKRGFEDSWGWEDKGDQKRLKTENSWGWDEPQKKEGEEDEDQMQGVESHGEDGDTGGEEEGKPENTVGLMLRQFGIAPDTLGWNEEDGMFAESLLR